MTLAEFRELSVGDTVFLDGVIDGKQFRKQWAVVTDRDVYYGEDDDNNEIAILVSYNDGEGDWWVGEEYCEYVFTKPRKSGLTKFLEATS